MPSSKGIVLSHEDFGEADRYIQFFTKDWGMITVLARSARKSKRRYVGGLDLSAMMKSPSGATPGKNPI